MSKQIPEPNYSQIPNILLDRMCEFTHVEFKVIMFVCRQTFGWHREKRQMSYSFIEEGCGLSHDAVHNALKTLLFKGWLMRNESGNSFEYQMCLISEQSAKQTDGSPPNGLALVRQTDTNKERVNKVKQKSSSNEEFVYCPEDFPNIETHKPDYVETLRANGWIQNGQKIHDRKAWLTALENALEDNKKNGH